MKKSLIALAVAGAMTVPAIASADATLYGSFRVNMENTDKQSALLRDAGSRIGVRGTVDLGLEDTKGIFLWEQSVSLDTGALGGGRYAHAGATGSWGTAVAGRLDHPTWTYVGNVTEFEGSGQSFGLNVGYGQTAAGGTERLDRRMGNTLAYVTPNFNGFQATIGGVFAGDNYSDEKDKTIDGYNLGAQYSIADLTLAAAYGRVKTGKSAEEFAVDQNLWGLAARYKFEGFRFGAKYERSKDKADEDGLKEAGYALYGGYEVNGIGASLGYSTVKISDNSSESDRLKAWQAEVYKKMGNGIVALGYVDFNKTAVDAHAYTTSGTDFRAYNVLPRANDTLYMSYRLNF